jgi:hypothetical protein
VACPRPRGHGRPALGGHAHEDVGRPPRESLRQPTVRRSNPLTPLIPGAEAPAGRNVLTFARAGLDHRRARKCRPTPAEGRTAPLIDPDERGFGSPSGRSGREYERTADAAARQSGRGRAGSAAPTVENVTWGWCRQAVSPSSFAALGADGRSERPGAAGQPAGPDRRDGGESVGSRRAVRAGHRSGRARSGSARDRPATDRPCRPAVHPLARRSRRGDRRLTAPHSSFRKRSPSFPIQPLQSARRDPASTRGLQGPTSPRSRPGATASGPGSPGLSAWAEDRPGAAASPAGDPARSTPVTPFVGRSYPLPSLLGVFLPINYTPILPFCQGLGVPVLA